MTEQHTTLLIGGRIHAAGAAGATAMAVTDDTVAWVGEDTVGRALHPDAAVVELDGAFVTPAFADSHAHATDTGLHLTGIDLSAVHSGQELLAEIAAAAVPGEVLIAHGWDESRWNNARIPSRAELDEAAGDTPVYLSRIDVHSALVSSALIELVPHCRNRDGFSSRGPLTRDAHHTVRGAARAAITAAQRRRAQRAFLDAAAAAGIASVHECAGPVISSEQDLTDLLELGSEPTRPEVIGYWGESGAVDTAHRLGASGLAGDLFADGALGSHTAALSAPYSDRPDTSGTRYLDAEAIGEHIAICTEAGLQAGFHVIGDAAVDEVVAGFRNAERRVGARALAAAGHRLEHVEMIAAEQARALAAWSVTAAMQPLFDAAWGGMHGMYATRLGPQRAATLNPFAMLASTGVPLAFGSDSPVTPLAPWETVRAATHHHTSEHALSARGAFNAHTRGAHRAAATTDSTLGTLRPGAVAHYAVWDAPELATSSAGSRATRWSTDPKSGVPALPPLDPDATLPRCLRTVRAGHTIYDAFG